MIIHSFQRKGWSHDTSHKPAREQPVYNQICCVLDKKEEEKWSTGTEIFKGPDYLFPYDLFWH